MTAVADAASFQSISQRSVTRLRSTIKGQILEPDSDGYDQARRIYNGIFDRRPALIAKCACVDDVQQALSFARENGCFPAIRGGGHSAAGFGVCDGGLVIDLTPMKSIETDRIRQTVKVQGGVTWGELDAATQVYGLATTGARISGAGVCGVTLGGGYGWLMRKYGLAIDNLLSGHIVCADGQLLRTSATEHPDLFWGIRGGGGNFGVVVSLEFRLHPVDRVTGGMVFYPAERGREVLEFYREFMSTAPPELSAMCNFLMMPAAPFVPQDLQGTRVVAIAVCHAGAERDAEFDLEPLNTAVPALLNRVRRMPYARLQRMYDAAGVFGHRSHGKSGHFADLSNGLLDAIACHSRAITSPLSIVMIPRLGGAVSEVGEDDSAFSHRDTQFDIGINAVWDEANESSIHIEWADRFWNEIRPRSRGVYVNELGQEGEARIREAYSPKTYARLVELKTTYDPHNLFRQNQNIQPRTYRNGGLPC